MPYAQFRRSLLTPTLLGTMLLLTTAIPATAQQEPVLLDAIVLQNQEDATGPIGDDLNPPTVTGSKIPVATNEVPQALTVLGTDDIRRFNATRASEALRYTAGVTADVFGDDQDYDWLRVRGFQADQTGIFLDNAQNLAFAFGSFYIDPYALERIEVLRGPSSALYGSSNPGGIVNYVSKRPGGRVRELVFGIDDAVGGSLSFDYGDDLGDTRSYRLTGRIEGGEKYDEFNHGLRGTLAPSFKFVTDGGTEVTLLANLHSADEQHNGSTFLPYFGTDIPTAQFGYIDADANFSDPDWDDYRRRQASVSAIVEHSFDNGFTFTGIGRVGVASVEESYWYLNGYRPGFPANVTPQDAAGTLNLLAFQHDSLVRTAQTDLRFYGTVETGAVSHDLLVGLDARFYDLDETQATGFASVSGADPTDPGTPTLFPAYRDGKTTQNQIGLYVQDQLRWGSGWIATFNLRQDWLDTEQTVRSGFGAPFDRSDSETSWRTALVYEFGNGLTPYATVSRSFSSGISAPSILISAPEPETARQYEVGVKWAPEGGNFSLSGAVFQLDRDNVIAGVFPVAQQQIGEIRSRGVELEGSYRFDNGLTLAGAATWLDVEIKDDPDAGLIGNTPFLDPELQLDLRGDYAFSGYFDGLNLGAGIRYQGESFADLQNTRKVGDATLLDVYAGYEFSDGLRADFAITNLADERYVTGCQGLNVCSYGSEREISLAITRHW